MIKKITLLLLIALLTSCASSRRLGRFFEEKALSTKKEPDRTNIMPLLYLSGTSLSILWPFIDKDEHGFSVRPLFNKEDDEYAFLFPLSAWNPVKGDGWVGPYVWNKNFQMLLPLFYKDQKRFQLLTYYNFKDNQGVFPIYNLSEESLWMLGLYDWEHTGHSSRHRVMYSILSHWETHNDGDYFRYTLPFASWNQGGDKGAIFFPLFWQNENKNGEASSILLPIYYYNKEQSGDSGFHTLLGGHTKSGNKTTTNVTPFWWSGRSVHHSYDTFFPLFYRGEDPTGTTAWGFPLFYMDKTAQSTTAITPLSWYDSDPLQNRLHIFPIYNNVEKFDINGKRTEHCWYSPAFLPLISKSTNQTGGKTQVLYGALFNSETKADETNGSLLGYLADWKSSEKSSHFRFPAIFNFDGVVGFSESEETSKVNIMLYSHEKTKTSTRRDIFPFMTWDSGENESSFSFLWRVFEKHERNGKSGGHIFFIPWGD